MTRVARADGPLVTGVLYPAGWDGDGSLLPGLFDGLRAIDPSIEIVDVRYEDPQELRAARAAPPFDGLREQAPALTDQQCDALGCIEIALAMDLPFDVSAVAPNLRWVQGVGAGVGQLASAGLAEADIRLTNAAGLSSASIAEFVMGRILQIWKRFRRMDEHQADHEWVDTHGHSVAGARLGVVGLGAIGTELARRAAAFDIEVRAIRRNPGLPTPDGVIEVLGPESLHDLLARSDIVVTALPASAETVDLMDAAAFAAMPEGSVFINVGRGSLVDEGALVAALDCGHLRAAAVDVTRVEPLPPDSALWDAPNLYISPHGAAAVDRYMENMYALFGDNIVRYLADEPLRNEVDSERGV